MSGRAKPKAGSSRSSGMGSAAGPSTHRFQDRRQERMRGAGTQVAIQRDFQFKLPPASARPPATAAVASTPTGRRKRGRPSGSGKRQSANLSDISSPNADPRGDASVSIGVPRRIARPAPPISSTPAASRTLQNARKSPLFRGTSYDEDQNEELGSQIGDDDDAALDEPFEVQDEQWDDNLPQVDISLPMIPSPSTPGSRRDSVRRMRPSIAASSVGDLTLGDTAGDPAYADSPAAHAASRNLDARKRKRQASPGVEARRQSRIASAGKALKKKSAQRQPPSKSGRSVISVPVDHDEDDSNQDFTVIEQQRGARRSIAGIPRMAASDSSTISRRMSSVHGRDMQKRLKRALSLVFPSSEVAEDVGDETNAVSRKKRKSRKYLNDVDVIWSFVDEELRVAIEEQPAKAPFMALKALRKSVRANFLALSEKTDGRTTLISHLIRARKHKRELRKQVFATRSELSKLTMLASDRQKELDSWKHEVNDVRKINSFLENLRDQATAWT